MIRILVADDHLLFRSMLEEMLKRDEDFEITASCANGHEALDCCREQTLDIALLDIGMPGKNGIEVLKDIKESCPKLKVVMLTTFEDDENIKLAVQLGADGYLIKDIMPETLIMSLKCIYNNMVVFHKGAYKLLQTAIADAQETRNRKVTIDNMVFDATDIKILQLIVQGKTNKEIGKILSYSEGTIKNKISKLLSVTGFSDRTELSVFAINQGIV
ncbi:MAG: response regulator transcription factor [Anaerovoracaceae bacterium]|jgi:DNA-binding NarL/FixJ family response regulator